MTTTRATLLTDAAKAIAKVARDLSPVEAWLTGDAGARLRVAIEDLSDTAIDIAEIAEELR